MAELVYILCFLTSGAVAVLLFRAYFRTGQRFLLWCGLGFVGLCLNNVFLTVDMMTGPNVDLSLWRNVPVLLGMGLLVFGLIWDNE